MALGGLLKDGLIGVMESCRTMSAVFMAVIGGHYRMEDPRPSI